jgi:hypothetical protein
MDTRKSGLEWLRKKGRATAERVAVSKYYTSDEAWPRMPVWWFEFPSNLAIKGRFNFLNLLCQVTTNSLEFHHLRVPMGLFLACKHHLGMREKEKKFSLYLSAEESRLFRELRGGGQIEFDVFWVDGTI